jgi:tetratricopeptide (TPR) repeat protein
MAYTLTQLTDLNIRKTVGRGHLTANRLREALDSFANLVRDYPTDFEAYLVLGDLYLAGDMFGTALDLYRQAQSLNQENLELENRINLAKIEGDDKASRLDPIANSTLELLYSSLSGNEQPVNSFEVDKATELLDEIIHSNNPAELVAKHLDQIETLLPALLELNIRQAKVENRADLISSLESLQVAINQGSGPIPVGVGGVPREDLGLSGRFAGKVALLVPDKNQPSSRALFIAECLSTAGCTCHIIDETNEADKARADVMIACNPHINPWLLEYMAANTASKLPVILDLDRDFEEMPVYAPDYLKMGLGSPANARAYSAALLLANMITVPSREFAKRLSQMGYKATALPDGWSRSNPLWDKTSNPRNTINIGWMGSTGLVEDIAEIRRIINRVIREFPRAQLVITENANSFQLFSSLPDNRKLFIPEVSQEDFPYILGQLDILTVPLKNIPYNLTQPDSILMEAGVKRLPWVGSRIPSFMEWNSGGLLADTLEEWHTNLRQLVMDGEMRLKIGDAGCRKAQQREMQLVKNSWIEIIDEVINHPYARGINAQKAFLLQV